MTNAMTIYRGGDRYMINSSHILVIIVLIALLIPSRDKQYLLGVGVTHDAPNVNSRILAA